MRRSWNPPKTNGNNDKDTMAFRSGTVGTEIKNSMFNNEFELTTEDGVGYRSPCVSLQPYHGSTSPAVQGRSVREFEEQMVALRKENFNLKLRLYFVEESIPGYHQAANSADGQETLRKQLIDVKVEAEVLRNDLKEKQAVLKDAAVALDKLTTAQQEAEMKYEEMLQELRQKLDSYERRSGMETSQSSGENLSQLLGHSDVAENLNAMKRISELEGLLTQSEQKILDFQSQISQLDELLAKRDETIGEYEDKVKELAFQNAELVESAENQAKDAANKERSLRGLRSANAQLKTENEQLNKALKLAQDNLHKEMTNAKMCEKTLRDQQDVLQKMQSTMTIKSTNTARLLERIQEYEKMVTKMQIERNIVKRENQFFRVIVEKLQAPKRSHQCYSFEKANVYHKSGATKDAYVEAATNLKRCNTNFLESAKLQEKFKFKHQFSVNICNSSEATTSCCHNANVNFMLTPSNAINFLDTTDAGGDPLSAVVLDDYLYTNYEDEFPPLRFSISDSSLFGNGQSLDNISCCSSALLPNFQISSVGSNSSSNNKSSPFCRNDSSSVINSEITYKDQLEIQNCSQTLNAQRPHKCKCGEDSNKS